MEYELIIIKVAPETRDEIVAALYRYSKGYSRLAEAKTKDSYSILGKRMAIRGAAQYIASIDPEKVTYRCETKVIPAKNASAKNVADTYMALAKETELWGQQDEDMKKNPKFKDEFESSLMWNQDYSSGMHWTVWVYDDEDAKAEIKSQEAEADISDPKNLVAYGTDDCETSRYGHYYCRDAKTGEIFSTESVTDDITKGSYYTPPQEV